MSKGLGRLQICILKTIQETKPPFVPTISNIYREVVDSYWGGPCLGTQLPRGEGWVWVYSPEDRVELKKRRASISQAILSLEKRGLVGKFEGCFFITTEGQKTINKI